MSKPYWTYQQTQSGCLTWLVVMGLLLLAALAARADEVPEGSLLALAAVEARADLEASGYDVANLDITSIRILEVRDRVPCNGTQALGCFAVYAVPVAGGTREYGAMAYKAAGMNHPHRDLYKVLVHEWKHALLWLAGDPTWGVHDARF